MAKFVHLLFSHTATAQFHLRNWSNDHVDFQPFCLSSCLFLTPAELHHQSSVTQELSMSHDTNQPQTRCMTSLQSVPWHTFNWVHYFNMYLIPMTQNIVMYRVMSIVVRHVVFLNTIHSLYVTKLTCTWKHLRNWHCLSREYTNKYWFWSEM